MDESYGILEYTETNFFNYIAHKTQSSYLEVSYKRQISYFVNYLNYHKTTQQTKLFFIYENEYVDQHYLDDYSAYYSKCFYPYDKTCARIHFFTSEQEKITSAQLREELKKALDGNPSIVNNDNYLGFIVIRPIPKTFFAKVCIKPTNRSRQPHKKILVRRYRTSLFGIELDVDTIAFQEQEKILSACATTALWSFYHAHPSMHNDNLPSGYMITKSAYSIENGHDSEFPNPGLSTDMICRSMKKYGISPKVHDLQHEDNNTQHFKEHLYAYNIHNVPAIYGVNVEKEKQDLHAVTILGYTLDETMKFKTQSMPLISHKIQHIHVHDDRYGAFLRINLDENLIVIKDKDEEVYTPNALILGIDESIRIDYMKIRNFCENFRERIVLTLSKGVNNYYTSKKTFEQLVWDIKLKNVNDLKKDMIKENIYNKMIYLTQSWPKYIWSAIVKNDKCQFEILFDATNIEQGKIFLGILYHDNDISKELKEDLEFYFDTYYSYIDEKRTPMLDEIQLFMQNKTPYYKKLTEEFGTLCMPKIIKKTEIDNDAILENTLVTICNSIESVENIGVFYEEGYDLIWLIDSNGCLLIGKEKIGSQQGHPSLIGGEPARIGGEIKREGEVWLVNPFSGRYSDEYSIEEKKKYINNVIKYKLQPSFPNNTFKLANIQN